MSQAECARQSQMNEQIDRLKGSMEGLQENITQLTQRLTNVTRVEPESPTITGEKAAEGLVPHANTIRNVTDEIIQHTKILTNLRDRLEV